LRKLRILPTATTPEINLDPDGFIKITGRSIGYHPEEFAEETRKWIDEYLKNPAELTQINFYLDYLSTNNLKFYTDFVTKFKRVTSENKKCIITWLYDEGDIDMLEKGQDITTFSGLDSNLIMINQQHRFPRNPGL
jgi:hypothetical protein